MTELEKIDAELDDASAGVKHARNILDAAKAATEQALAAAIETGRASLEDASMVERREYAAACERFRVAAWREAEATYQVVWARGKVACSYSRLSVVRDKTGAWKMHAPEPDPGPYS